MEDKQKFLALGGIGLLLLTAIVAQWRKPEKEAAPELAQVAVTQPIRVELLKIARAQQSYHAENNRFGSLEELISSGALAMKSLTRGVYQYTAEVEEQSFVVTARAQREEADRWPVLTINERMEIFQQPAAAGRK